MKIINLKEYGIGRYSDASPFPMGDLELKIVGLPAFSGEFRFLAFCNDMKIMQKSITAANNTVFMQQDKLSAGKLWCFVSHYVDGIKVKRYTVEDILITDDKLTLRQCLYG